MYFKIKLLTLSQIPLSWSRSINVNKIIMCMLNRSHIYLSLMQMICEGLNYALINCYVYVAILTRHCIRPPGSLIPSVALLPLINVLSQNSDKMIDTQHAAPPSEAGDASQHLMSTHQLTGRVAASTQGSCLTGQSATNNNWPQQSPQTQPQQHLSMPMFL